MTNLSERVMSLSGPDREVDAEIAVFLKHGCRANLADDLEYLSMPNKHDPGHGVAPGHYWFHCRSGMSLRSAPNYTASIDAAMTLVPEGDPAFSATFWRLGNDGEGADPAEFKAEILLCSMLTSKRLSATASTPALALCAAALLAREASNGDL